MEEIRKHARETQKENRGKKRDFLQDNARNIDIYADIRTRADMKKSAEMLCKKSAVTPELLVAIKNGLLMGNEMIRAFLEISPALPSLLRLFSVSGVDARLQILAAHCLCNLALGGSKISTRLAKAAGPYLVIHMEGLNPLVVEASLWTIGNISQWKEPFEILHAQGAYNQAAKLLSSTGDDFVRDAAAFCLIRAFKHNFGLFSNEEYALITNHALSVTSPDSGILLLCSLMAYHPSAAAVMVQQGLHLNLLTILQKMIGDNETSRVSVTRILANLVTEQNGQVAAAVLSDPLFVNFSQNHLSHPTAAIVKETAWLLANLLHHPSSEISSAAVQLGVMTWLSCLKF